MLRGLAVLAVLAVIGCSRTEARESGGAWASWSDAPPAAATASSTPAPVVAAPPRAEPELPRGAANLTASIGSAGARRIFVRHGEDLQSALDAARPGDVLLLETGATFMGNFTLRAKAASPSDTWITVRSAAMDAQLPSQGARITPSFAAFLPKLVSPNADPALRTEDGAHHYRILGIEATVAQSVALNNGIITFGERSQRIERVPHHIILERSYVHGHSTLNVKRCVALNSAATAIIDSYLSECHAKGFDSQAICGWNGPGPFRIANNYLEGAGENVMFGGADPSIRDLVPSDIDIRHNHFTRPVGWKGVWTVKNLLELKNARRVLVEGNVFENHWADAQSGSAIVWFSVNQDGGAPWSVVRDVTFRYNRVRNVGGGISIAAGQPQAPASHMKVADNVFENVNVGPFTGNGRVYQVLDALDNISIDHNTSFTNDVVVMFDVLPQRTNFSFSNNLTTRGQYGIAGSDAGEGTTALTRYLAPGYRVVGNVLIGASDGAKYPQDNFFPASPKDVGFVDYAARNYRLAAHSRFKRIANDKRDPGADLDAVDAATKGVVLQ